MLRVDVKICEVCKKEYRVKHSVAYRRKHCSKKCKAIFDSQRMKGNVLNNGSRKGERNNLWRGNDVGYGGVHKWVRKYYGVPKKCELCGTSTVPVGYKEKYFFQWSSKTGKYNRLRETWWTLCVKCHEKYDREILNKYKKIK